MALTTVSSNTQSCTVDTIHDLATSTDAAIFVAQWNLTNSAKGDVFRCFVKAKVLTGDTAETAFEGIYANDLGNSPIVCSPPILSMFSLTMSIEQTDGTSRNVPWALVKVAT